MIRSLSGSRVQILEDGQSILGMNALSGDINIPFDPLFVRSATVNKSSDSVRFGGNAIGGSVDVDSGLISRKMEARRKDVELVLRKGFNDADAQGLRMNFNDQQHFSTNVQLSFQKIGQYDDSRQQQGVGLQQRAVPGQRRRKHLSRRQLPERGDGYSSSTTRASQPYIEQFMTAKPGLGRRRFFLLYQSSRPRCGKRKTYVNPANPAYVPGTPTTAQNKISNDVTPDYHGTLGNSHVQQYPLLPIGSDLFFRPVAMSAVSLDTKE